MDKLLKKLENSFIKHTDEIIKNVRIFSKRENKLLFDEELNEILNNFDLSKLKTKQEKDLLKDRINFYTKSINCVNKNYSLINAFYQLDSLF